MPRLVGEGVEISQDSGSTISAIMTAANSHSTGLVQSMRGFGVSVVAVMVIISTGSWSLAPLLRERGLRGLKAIRFAEAPSPAAHLSMRVGLSPHAGEAGPRTPLLPLSQTLNKRA